MPEKTLYFTPKTPVQPSGFEISKQQPKTLTMGKSPLDGVFRQMDENEVKRKGDLSRFSGLFNRLIKITDSAEKETKKMKREFSSFREEMEAMMLNFETKINSLKIPKSSEKEVMDLSEEISDLREKISRVETESKKEGVAGGVGSKIIVHRNLGKLFKKETPRGTINGSNKEFYLTKTPLAGFLILEKDGQGQSSGDDYLLVGNKITYLSTGPQNNHYAVFF